MIQAKAAPFSASTGSIGSFWALNHRESGECRFIAVEQLSETLDGAYARVVATLHLGYSEALLQLARQGVAGGMDHYNRFREMASSCGHGRHQRRHKPLAAAGADRDQQSAGKALDLQPGILSDLGDAYRRGNMEDAGRPSTRGNG